MLLKNILEVSRFIFPPISLGIEYLVILRKHPPTIQKHDYFNIYLHSKFLVYMMDCN